MLANHRGQRVGALPLDNQGGGSDSELQQDTPSEDLTKIISMKEMIQKKGAARGAKDAAGSGEESDDDIPVSRRKQQRTQKSITDNEVDDTNALGDAGDPTDAANLESAPPERNAMVADNLAARNALAAKAKGPEKGSERSSSRAVAAAGTERDDSPQKARGSSNPNEVSYSTHNSC